MFGPAWAQLVVAAASTLAAVAYIYTKWVHPFITGVHNVITKMSTLEEIAEEFRPNHGTTLRDTIDRMDQRLVEHIARVRASHDEVTAQLADTIVSLHAHMDDDKDQFAQSSVALIAGQQQLVDRLAAIEAAIAAD